MTTIAKCASAVCPDRSICARNPDCISVGDSDIISWFMVPPEFHGQGACEYFLPLTDEELRDER